MEYCPDARLEPKEPPYQWILNRLYRLQEERLTVSHFAEDQEFCKDTWKEILDAYDDAIEEEQYYLQEAKNRT